MSWLSDIFTDGGGQETRRAGPAERILQLRRGISAAAASLPPEQSETADAAVEAADDLADRVAALVETPGPTDDVEVETPDEDVDAAGWLREGPARRREAGGPAGAEVADAGAVPDDVAEKGAELLNELHFSLLRLEVLRAEPDAIPVRETIEAVRELAGRLPEAEGQGGGPPGDDGSG